MPRRALLLVAVPPKAGTVATSAPSDGLVVAVRRPSKCTSTHTVAGRLRTFPTAPDQVARRSERSADAVCACTKRRLRARSAPRVALTNVVSSSMRLLARSAPLRFSPLVWHVPLVRPPLSLDGMSGKPRYRYGPSRAFVYVVGAVLAVQLWHALPESAGSLDTAPIERAVYTELQRQRPVADVRCTRVDPEVANCIATLPDTGRTSVTARLDAASGEVTATLLDGR